jgi:hypothetical protein
VKLSLVSRHLPRAEGPAAARALLALGQGLEAIGQPFVVWSWGVDPPTEALPAWCQWRAVPSRPALAVRARALVRPRSDVADCHLPLDPGSLAVADDPLSFAAVAGHPRAAVTLHYATKLDAGALRRVSPRQVQDWRAERWATKRARLTLAYSDRVASWCRNGAVAVPMACPVPENPLPVVEAPVAACLADWTWPPNAVALQALRQLWPLVRAHVPAARLLLAGDGLPAEEGSAGIELCGRVDEAVEILGQAAVVVFHCPPTSGPKMKVLEALSYALPVVTTAAGAEGVWGAGEGNPVVVPSDPALFAATVAGLLTDAARRLELGLTGRKLMLAAHAPRPAATARMAALQALAT